MADTRASDEIGMEVAPGYESLKDVESYGFGILDEAQCVEVMKNVKISHCCGYTVGDLTVLEGLGNMSRVGADSLIVALPDTLDGKRPHKEGAEGSS